MDRTRPTNMFAARHYPAANAAAVINVAAFAVDSLRRVRVKRIHWSYSAAPTGGLLTVEDGGGSVIRKFYITSGGPGSLPFETLLAGAGNAAIITLAAGGAGISGTLDVEYGTIY